MRNLVLYLSGCFLLSLCAEAAPVQLSPGDSLHSEQQGQFHLGLGISVEPSLFGAQDVYFLGGEYLERGIHQPGYASAPVNIYIPLAVTKRFRIEPVVGYYSYSNEKTSSSSGSQYIVTDRLKLIHVGLRLHALFPIAEHFQTYLGPQGGFVTEKVMSGTRFTGGSSMTDEQTTTTEAYLAGLSFGCEYYPLPSFSLGGEAAVRYLWYGNPEISTSHYPPGPGSSTKTEIDRSFFTTGVLFFVRWFCI